ncbi:MAG: HEAT repeat domain-containing protein [Planctomycetes bacterium]|nr:HEAT repeat domain-containing protein [Planctomycetota bacterium]
MMMKTLFTVSLAVLMLTLVFTGVGRGDEVLSNQDIIDLIKAGINSELVKIKIKTTENDFEVSAENMVILRTEGVPDDVIALMLSEAEKSSKAKQSRLDMNIRFLTSNRAEARQAAYLALLQLGDKARNEMLEMLSSNADTRLRAAICQTLGKMKATEAIPLLQVLLDDPDSEVRLGAADGLAELGVSDAQRALIRIEGWGESDREQPVDGYLRLAGLLGERAAQDGAILILQESINPTERSEAIRLLGLFKIKDSARKLEQALIHDRDQEVRATAAKALARIGDPESPPVLITALKKDRPNRIPLIRALASYRSKEVIPVLISLMADPEQLQEEETKALLASLRRLTHQDFGLDQARWLKWWEENEEELDIE